MSEQFNWGHLSPAHWLYHDGCLLFFVIGHCTWEQQTQATVQSVICYWTDRIEVSSISLRIWFPCSKFWKWSGAQVLCKLCFTLLEKTVKTRTSQSQLESDVQQKLRQVAVGLGLKPCTSRQLEEVNIWKVSPLMQNSFLKGSHQKFFKERYTINEETIYTHISHNNKLWVTSSSCK